MSRSLYCFYPHSIRIGILKWLKLTGMSCGISRWTYPDFFNRYRVLMTKSDMMATDKKLVCKNLLKILIKVRNFIHWCVLSFSIIMKIKSDAVLWKDNRSEYTSIYATQYFVFGPHDYKSLTSLLRSQTCSSSARQRSSSELARSHIWRRSGQISFAQPVSRFRRLLEVGCRESDIERSTKRP